MSTIEDFPGNQSIHELPRIDGETKTGLLAATQELDGLNPDHVRDIENKGVALGEVVETEVVPKSLSNRLKEAAERRDAQGRSREFTDTAIIFADNANDIEIGSMFDSEHNLETSIVFSYDNIDEVLELLRSYGLGNINLGLFDTELSAHILVKEGKTGGNVVLRCPISIGSMGVVLSSNEGLDPSLKDAYDKLKTAYDKADGETFERDNQKNRQLYDELHDAALALKKDK